MHSPLCSNGRAHSDGKMICEVVGNDLDFDFVHCDCEQGFITSVKTVFPNALIKLCRFHIVDAIRRHADSQGLRPLINRSSDFKKFYHRVRQIFFYPTHLWHRVWHLILGEMSDETRNMPQVQDFIEYLVSDL